MGVYNEDRFITEYKDCIVFFEECEIGVDYIIRVNGEFIKYVFDKEGEYIWKGLVDTREVFENLYKGVKFMMLLLKIVKIEILLILFIVAVCNSFYASKDKLYEVFYNYSTFNIALLLIAVYGLVLFSNRRGIYGKEVIKNYFNILLALFLGVICVKLGDCTVPIKIAVIVLFSLFTLSSTAYLCEELKMNDYYGKFKKRFSV